MAEHKCIENVASGQELHLTFQNLVGYAHPTKKNICVNSVFICVFLFF